MFEDKNGSLSPVKGVLIAYIVLILHVLLAAFIGILVLFFRGIINYILWIFLISILWIFLFFIYFYRKIGHVDTKIKSVVCSTKKNRHFLEVNFFWGLASFKLSPSIFELRSSKSANASLTQLELCEFSRVDEMARLAGLLEKKLITIDEYNEAKKRHL